MERNELLISIKKACMETVYKKLQEQRVDIFL